MRQAPNKQKKKKPKEIKLNLPDSQVISISRSLQPFGFFCWPFFSSTFGSVCQLSPTQIGADLTNLWAISVESAYTSKLPRHSRVKHSPDREPIGTTS